MSFAVPAWQVAQPAAFAAHLDVAVLLGFAAAMVALALAWFRRE